LPSKIWQTLGDALRATIYAEADLLKGVTENIMLGHLAPIGIGGSALHV
jgi:DNA-directed RNA polymerase II subunit RPB1